MSFSQLVDKLSSYIRQACLSVGWLTLGMVLITTSIVIFRYGFDSTSMAVRDGVIYLHAVVVWIGISYNFATDEHVRVDVIYTRLSAGSKDLVNLFGNLFFLLPICLVILIYALPYVQLSWRIWEGSAEVGGLPGVFLVKSLLLIGSGLLLLQTVLNSIQICLRWLSFDSA